MKTAKYLLFTFYISLSCSSPIENGANITPENLIPEKEFIELLYQMQILEGARTGSTVLGDSILLRYFYEHLYTKQGVTTMQVRSSFAYYHSNPKKMSEYYQWIIDSLRQDVYELNEPLKE
ncbi:MAG: Uncharacterised protein [Owenweeksia sp. TMED14]|nr:MAG: Uncharacterised protein [Owenweeksia sp. TMED14]|tara:strand:- start:1039 stop:1401 length:363 start_codon:yes stop_codon:yes gene_type:complete